VGKSSDDLKSLKNKAIYHYIRIWFSLYSNMEHLEWWL